MYTNQGPSGGRPYMDPVLMVKLLVLQAWYGLSDPELERQAGNRIDFMHFLGFPEKAPDYSTVWRFRERLAEPGRDRLVWKELQSARAPPEKACLECHDVSKVHASEVMLTDCVTCHDFLVNNDQLIPQRADCLECHMDKELVTVSMPAEAHADTTCTNCHDPHENRVAESCSTCHEVEEGLHDIALHTDCTSCHVPHQDVTVRETCESCHTDKVDHYTAVNCVGCHG